MTGEMVRLLKRKVLVRGLHAGNRVLYRFIASRLPGGEAALRLDPGAQPLGQGLAEALNRDEAAHLLGIDAGITSRDVAAERMANQSHGRKLPLVNELREIVDK